MSNLVPILLYHSIAEHPAQGLETWTVSPSAFTGQLTYLIDHNYTPLTVSQFVTVMNDDDRLFPEKPVLITFDDGFADFWENAFPVLKRFNVVSSLYIATGYIEETSRWLEAEGCGNVPMLTWEQIAEISDSGLVELGSHSLSHSQLDTLSLDEAHKEIGQSKIDLEQALGKPVTTFAYPHGYHGPAVRKLVIEAGYSSACAVKHAISTRSDDCFALSRIFVFNNTDIERFKMLLVGQGLRVAPAKEQLQTKIWRFVRRTYKRSKSR